MGLSERPVSSLDLSLGTLNTFVRLPRGRRLRRGQKRYQAPGKDQQKNTASIQSIARRHASSRLLS